ncbi:MAG: UPF0280 family protein [Sulfitobacter sp.]
MQASAHILPCGKRLHLQHGPIDLIIGADGDRQAAFHAATTRFATILQELVAELPDLKRPLSNGTPIPQGSVAKRMDTATRPFIETGFVTRMAAVAGSVADCIMHAMAQTPITRAYVNNGGDIALHLTQGQSFSLAMAGHDGTDLGRITVHHEDPIRGIATSGRLGRSHSLGIADSVTVLAPTAACADVAATLIANAVDLPNHPAISRRPACDLDDTSDLGAHPVVVGCNALSAADSARALARGRARANSYIARDLITGAALFVQNKSITTCPAHLTIAQRSLSHA